jgi:short-subunit dehydrogenase
MSILTNTNSTFGKIATYATVGAGAFLIARAFYRAYTKYDLRDKVVLITGGSRGLGLVLARQLAERGARLAICARTTDALGKAHVELENMGAEVLSMTVDVTDHNQVRMMISDVIEHYGKLDLLINNAGVIQVGPQEALNVMDYEEAIKTNFWAPLYTILESIPYFKLFGEGRVVNITSIGGKIAVPHMLPYTVSKFALVGLSQGMQAELKKDNIKVTTIVPGLMNTGSPRNITVKGDHEAEYAWFKASASSPWISQDVEQAASGIIQAIEYGDSEAVLSFTAKAATVLNGLMPGWMSGILGLVNGILPANTRDGYISKKGYESESDFTLGVAADEAAVRNNEFR